MDSIPPLLKENHLPLPLCLSNLTAKVHGWKRPIPSQNSTGAQTDNPLSSRGFGAFLIPEGWLSGLQSCQSSFPGWICPRENHPQNNSILVTWKYYKRQYLLLQINHRQLTINYSSVWVASQQRESTWDWSLTFIFLRSQLPSMKDSANIQIFVP